jgi:NADH-quinone oxidoreductase subunit C
VSALVLQRLKDKFGDAILATCAQHGDETAVVAPARLLEICAFLRDDPETRMAMLVDLTCVDTLGLDDRAAGRFEVVYHLRSMASGRRVRLKVLVDDGPKGVEAGEPPEIDSVVALWKGANWFEREAFDMYGVRFRGHPDLRRILMYDEFVGHPLRKDYPKEKRQPLVRRDYA